MSIVEYERAVTTMSLRPDMQDFVGPRHEALVQSAEAVLGLRFPASYRRFLLEYGAGSFGSAEVYGIVDGDFEHSSVPNGIWYTLRERRDSGLPRAMVVIYSDGMGDLYCLDCQDGNAELEAPVVRYQPGVAPGGQRAERIAKDFGSFLLELVGQETYSLQRTTEKK